MPKVKEPIVAVPSGVLLDQMRANIPNSFKEKSTIKKLMGMDWRWYDSQTFHKSSAKCNILEKPIIKFDKALVESVWNIILNSESTFDPSDILKAEKAAKKFILTASEERALFLQFDYAKSKTEPNINAARKRKLTLRECQEIVKWGTLATTIRDTITVANLGLILAMAKKYGIPQRADGLEIMAEGFQALLKSIDRFESSRGFKLSTYACRSIIKAFQRASIKSEKFRLLNRPIWTTDDEGMDVQMELRDKTDMFEEVYKKAEIIAVVDVLNTNKAELTDIERNVIQYRFLDENPITNKPFTLEEVGEIVGLTKERIRQIQMVALKKLKLSLENVTDN